MVEGGGVLRLSFARLSLDLSAPNDLQNAWHFEERRKMQTKWKKERNKKRYICLKKILSSQQS